MSAPSAPITVTPMPPVRIPLDHTPVRARADLLETDLLAVVSSQHEERQHQKHPPIIYLFIDVDECAGQGLGNNCDAQATCTNTAGSFTCACKVGFQGNGANCTGIFPFLFLHFLGPSTPKKLDAHFKTLISQTTTNVFSGQTTAIRTQIVPTPRGHSHAPVIPGTLGPALIAPFKKIFLASIPVIALPMPLALAQMAQRSVSVTLGFTDSVLLATVS